MIITIVSTDNFKEINGHKYRVWSGENESGERVFACVAALIFKEGPVAEQAARELKLLDVRTKLLDPVVFEEWPHP